MEEDNITLSFNLAVSVVFHIGDYIDDPVFGHFVISEEPVPADYDPITGAYKYTLRFDADWIFWKNYILMLTYNGARRETSWVLTDTLENHLSVVIQNLTAVGYTGYSINADANTVPDKGKAVCVTYSGTSILDALKNLANAYECEFWVADKVILFGKCEMGTDIHLSMSDEGGRTINVANMVPTRNDSEYGNRFFAYGSTKNLPETYRKHLSFKADTTSRIGGFTAFKDSMRSMFPDFLKRSVVQASNPVQHSYTDAWLDYSYAEEEDHDEMITWKNIRVERTTAPIPVVQGWPFTITPYNSPYVSFEYTVYIYDQGGNLLASSTNVLTPMTYTIPDGVDKITVRYSYEDATHLYRPAPLPPTVEWLDNTEYGYFAQVSYEGGTFLVRLEDGWFRAVSRDGSVTYMNPPVDFIADTEYTLLTTGDDAIKVASIPYSYYTDDDDTTDSVRILGERRLMLPRPPYMDADLVAIESHIENGYEQRDTTLTRDQIVERVVFFDEIYPRCALRITHVDVGEYANDTTYSDGSVKIANLPAYTIQAELITRSGDVGFPFDPTTMMVVGKLTATFLTPDETKAYSGLVSENASSLMGMTFDVACNRANGITTYQLAWNEDYGEKLPNEVLMPKVGDAFILAGWNPAAMPALGLIDAAEKELALTAERYAELLEEAQFTFDCTMMSNWVLARMGTISASDPYKKLILPGQKVVVYHGALAAPKETRVIGFEYKLDIPYDSPVITVGESDAYSRLREIEKSLHASSQSTTASSNTTSVNMATGGTSGATAGGGKVLHLTPGTMTGMSPVDYDGSEEKTFRVPSVIDHLVDADRVPRIATNIAGDKVLVDKDGNEVSGKQFFEEKVDPLDSTKKYIQLKEEYTGLLSPFWMAAGGIGSGGGGGGGLINGVYIERDLGSVYSQSGTEDPTKTFSAFAIDKIWQAVVALQQATPNVGLVNGANNSTLTVNGTTADFYTKSQVDNLIANIDLDGYVTEAALATAIAGVNVLADITTSQDGTVDFTWHNGDVVKVDLNHQHSNYVEITRTINGHALSDNVVLSAVTDLGVAEWAIGGGGSTIPFNRLPSMYVAGARVYDGRERVALITVNAISHELSSGSSDKSRIVWDGDANAWHFLGNVYADGWISAGGIGEGGAVDASYLKYLTDVHHGSNGVLRADGTAVQPGDALVYLNANTGWVASPVSGGGSGAALSDVWASLTNTVADAYANTQINILHIPNITTAKITDLETWIAGKGYALSSAIPTSLAQLSDDSTHRLVTDAQITSWGAKSTVAISNLLPQATGRTRVATISIDGTNYDIFSPEAGGGSVGTETDPIFSASAAFGITAQNIASWNAKSDFSGSYNDLTDKPTIPGAQVNADWNAVSGVAQILNKPSSLPASDVPAWAKAADKPSYSLTEISGTDDLRAIEALAGTDGILKKTAANTWSLDTTTYLTSGATLDDIADGTTRKLSNYLPLVGGTMTGHITMSGASLLSSADSANSIGASDKRFNQAFIRNIYTSYLAFRSDDGQTQRGTFGIGDGNAAISIVGSPNNTVYNFYAGSGFFHGGNGEVPCGRSDHRWSKMWSVDADLSGDLSLASTSHIDIGPVRIEYDQQNDAIHITTNDPTNHPTIGIYADGFGAAGGVGQTS